jgi:putative hydrolase
MSQQPFGDIPLFREIQKLLQAGGGPVNPEIARQVATALAVQAGEGALPEPVEARLFSDGVHAAEGLLAGYTRLELVEPIRSALITRSNWVVVALNGWTWLIDHAGRRFVEEMKKLGGAGDEGDAIGASLEQVAPLMLGIQAGTLVGNLAQEIVGRHDLPIDYEGDDRLFCVWPNAKQVADDYQFDQSEFLRWLALHGTARHLVVRSVPWVSRYQRALLTEIVDSTEIDVGDLERHLLELQNRGPEVLEQGMDAQDLVPVVQTERHKSALGRLRSFHALLEGYARHAAGEVAQELIADTSKIDEAMSRHAASSRRGETMLAGILGISFDRKLEAVGTTFAAAVAQMKGIAELTRVWDAPDNLPSIEELRDPFAWIERVLADEE